MHHRYYEAMALKKHVPLSLCFAAGLELVLIGAGNNLESTVGTYNCVTSSNGRVVDRFESVNVGWGPWLRVVATDKAVGQPEVDYIYVGRDAASHRWNIVGVSSTGTYWARHSTSLRYDGSHWVDDYPQDGGRAVIRVLASGAQYSFDLARPKSGGGSQSSHTLCTRI